MEDATKPDAQPTRPPLNVIHGEHSSQPDRVLARAPTLTHHTSHSLGIPTPDFLNPIASGAHYAGALSTSMHEHANKGHNRRSLSMFGGDPVVIEMYKDVLKDIEDLFCARPTPELFQRRWREDGEYEDPMTKAYGYSECAAQFFGLAKICSSSSRISCRILSATLKPNKLVLAQTQEYTIRWLGIKKVISSFVLVDLDEDLKIIKLVDQWNGDKLPTRWGLLQLRRFTAKLVGWFVTVPRPSSTTC